MSVSNAIKALATKITKRGFLVFRIRLINVNHRLSALAMFDTGLSFSFVDKSILSTLQLQGQKASLSVAVNHGSQNVKNEIVQMAVSEHEKSRLLKTLQFYVQKNIKLGDQSVDLLEFNGRYPHLRSSLNWSYNLNEVQLLLNTTLITSANQLNSISQTKRLHHGQSNEKLIGS